jgi:3-deoxy-D-manno-octulosonate 8-phosphate phosphatase (KDO 8-P phosphatase)
MRTPMTTPAEIAAKFERRGAAFVAPAADIAAKLARIRALVFDWDGVFNRGEKSSMVSSGFNEADSMGVNMLRFGLWYRDARLPIAAIVTGEANPTAELFATRERFHWLFQGVRDKRQAVAAICESEGLAADEVACIFDDINDLSMARVCGVRILVRRRASVLLHDRVAKLRECDYITASGPGEYAVRETAELLLGLLDMFDVVIDSRVANDERYCAYFSERQAVTLRKAGIADDGALTGAQ